MAITALVNGGAHLINGCLKTKNQIKMVGPENDVRQVRLAAADLLLSVTAIVLAILVLLNVISLPSGVGHLGQTLSAGAIGAGVVGLITSVKGLRCVPQTYNQCKEARANAHSRKGPESL